jgi:ABC-2 type transport system permease protein
MRNILLVSRHEILTTLKKRSFWFLTIVFPGIIILINLIMQVATRSAFHDDPGIAPEINTAVSTIGYIDRAGLISQIPPDVPSGLLLEIDNEAMALSMLQRGEIAHYFIIPVDFLESGRVLQIDDEVNPMGSMNDRLLEYIVYYNLTGDEQLAKRLVRPAVLNMVSLAPDTNTDINSGAFLVPFATMFIFFLALSMSSSFMLQSVSQEKENRTVEILLVSINPRQLMVGKVLGFSMIAMIQLLVWLGAGILALNRSRMMIPDMSGYSLPPGFVVWALLYFIFGYLTYASIMGAIGALAPNMREGSQFTFIAILPLLLPMWLSNTFIFSPNGALSTFLSLFPLTAPTSMMTRMVSTKVPIWQTALGLALLMITAYFFIIVAARFFRADTLLSGSSLKWKRVFAELKKSGE